MTDFSSLFRIGGIASGLDTNSLIDQLMAVERKPVDLLENQKQLLSWKKDFWSSAQTSLNALNTSIQTLLQKSTMLARSATSADQTIVTANATSGAALATYTVNVANLATSTKVLGGLGSSGLGVSGTIDPTMPVSSYTSKFNNNPTAGTFTVNGITFTLSDTNADSIIDKIDVTNASGSNIYSYTSTGSGVTLNDIINAFNDTNVSAATGVTASYNSTSDKLSVTASAPGGALNLGSGGDTSNFLTSVNLINAVRVGDTKTSVSHLGEIRTTQILSSANFATPITGDVNGNGQFTINGVTISYNKNTDTLQNVIDRINSSAAGVNASYDSIQDRLILTNTNTGSTSITRSDVTGNFLAATNLLTTSTGVSDTVGTNANFTISGVNNGSTISSASNTVSGIVPGVTFNLLKQGQTTVTIGQDNTKAEAAIKDFVDKYNATLTLVNSKLDEQRVQNPQTLADQQQGLLAGNMDLFQIKSDLVDKATSAVSGMPDTMQQLAQIGISITSDDFGKSGMLTVDTTKLEAALNSNSNQVASLFFNDTNGNGTVDPGEDGVAAKLSTYLNQLLVTGGTDTTSRYENTDPSILYTGSWGVVADPNASGGTVSQSGVANDNAQFTFTGGQVSWYATKGADQGIASVYIDGVYRQDVDLYSATTQNKQNVFTAQGLSDGQHTIKIVVTGNKNASSSGTNVNIDALDVTFTNNTGTVPEQTSELQSEMSDIDSQVSSMNVRLNEEEQTLIQKFTAMELAVSQLQQMGSRFQAALSGMGGSTSLSL